MKEQKGIFFDDKFENTYSSLKRELNTSNTSLPSSLTFSESFKRAGKQGLLGILKFKSKGNKNNVVYKISQYMNYLIDQENLVMQSLNRLRHYCPNFCKGYGKVTTSISPDFRKVENPFHTEERYQIKCDALLMEWINPAKKLYRYLKNESVSEDIIFSLIKQTLLAIRVAQNKVQFSHYDLHSNNVLVRKCKQNSLVFYIFDKDNAHLVPTFGNYPVIIDYGFAYSGDMEDKPLYSALPHTDVGFMSDRFDPIADPKLFLVTVSDELKNYRKSKTAKVFRKIVRNIFKPLKIDWESGWDDSHDVGASDYIINMLEDTERESRSKFFKHCGHYCIDIAQKLITLPIKQNKYKRIEKMYAIIIEEFKKIEKEISSDFYNLYIFREMINIATDLKDDYIDDDKRDETVKIFKRRLLEVIGSIAKYCAPKLDYEKLLCSLYIFARQMEGCLYEVMTERMKVKNKEYSKMKIHYAHEMYEAIETNIPTKYDVNEETIIYIFDTEKEVSQAVKVPEMYLSDLNSLSNLERSQFIYKLYTKGCLISTNEKIVHQNDTDSEDEEKDEVLEEENIEREEIEREESEREESEREESEREESESEESEREESEREESEREESEREESEREESEEYQNEDEESDHEFSVSESSDSEVEDEDVELFTEDMDPDEIEKILSKMK